MLTKRLQVGREEPDDEDHFVCFGRFRTVIVGIQYYTGAVNNNEVWRALWFSSEGAPALFCS
jgi:hypothetical protein